MSVVDGIVSGLDTTSVIRQLMAIERAPVTRLEAKQAAADRRLQAWGDIKRAVGSLRETTLALARASTFSQATARSSNTALATVTAEPNTRVATASFKVLQLATAHSIMTTASVGSATELTGEGRVVAGVGLQALGITAIAVDAATAAQASDVTIAAASGSQVTVTIGDASVTVERTATSVTVGGFTLSVGSGGLVDGEGAAQVVATNATSTASTLAASFTSVRANVLSLTTGASADRRLVFTSPTAGEANQVLVGSTGLSGPVGAALGTMSVVGQARNAEIEVGDGLVIERATNDLDDVFSGLSVHLVKADADEVVSVAAETDLPGLSEKISQWVKAVNATVSLLDSKTAFDKEAGTGGPLLGDSAARNVRQLVTSALSVSLPAGTFRTMSDIGITFGRNGQYQLDETKLEAALADDPASVGALFARGATATNDAVSFSSATEATAVGTYAVAITAIAERAEAVGNVVAALGGNENLTITLGSRSFTVALATGQTPGSIVNSLNAALRNNDVAASADLDDDGALRIRSNAYGSAVTLLIASDRVGADATGLAGAIADTPVEYTGADVAGTIAGVAALGTGRNLTASTGPAAGLRLEISATSIGSLGDVTYVGGVGGSLLQSLGLTGGADAFITQATRTLSLSKSDFAKRILDYEDRLASTERRIRAQFTQMETILNSLRSQQSRLTSAIRANDNSFNTNG